MIILLALLTFAVLLKVLQMLLKDFTRFVWKKTTSISLPNSFVDFGEYAVTVVFVLALAVLGVLFYKFGTAFFAYLFSGDLISFFISLRGVFSVESETQNPFSWQHIISLLVTPALQFATFYFIYRSIRTFMFSINRTYGNSYSESDVLYFGFLSSMYFILIEIVFYSQDIPIVSQIAHFSYLALSKLSAIGFYLAVAHIQLLKNEQYRTNLPTYVNLTKIQSTIIYSPKLVILITYLLGLVLCIPFYTGTQFMLNNTVLISILVVFSAFFFFILRLFLSGVFNYLGVVMLAESTAHLTPNGKMFEAKTEKRIMYAIAAIALLFAILKLKLFLVIIFLFVAAVLLYIILHSLSYFIGLGISVGRLKAKKLEQEEISGEAVGKYLLTTTKAAAQATTPMFGFIFFVFALFSFFPKHFEHKNENYVHSVFDETGNPLYVEHTDGNGCVPVAHLQVPAFFFKCLYIQEDRSFARQNSWVPQKSNWHGISLATFYRFFSGGGGSNLNMQLIKNIAFPKSFPQDVQRKFSESLAAYQLSLQTTDTAIVTGYLNEVGMTGGINQSGVMQGSLYTFGLPISELNQLEIMYLVATLPRGSSFKTKKGAVNYVDAASHKEDIAEELLRRAKSWEEQGLLTLREYNSLRNQELRFTNKSYRTICGTTTNQFLLKQMRDSEIDFTTFNSSITFANQQRMSAAVKKFNAEFQRFKRVQGCDLYTAAIVVDVKTGNVIAHYGSEGVTDLTQFEEGNSVGSIIKPFLLLELLEAGFNFDDIQLYDGQIRGRRTPNNYSGHYSNRNVGINEILGRSLNAPMANIREVTDPLTLFNSVEEHLADMNISADNFLHLDNVQRRTEHELNYPLGSRNMTLFEIAQAYQTLFNGGQCLELSVFTSAYDPYTYTTHQFVQKQRQVYNHDNADQIATALSSAMQAGGTGTHIKSLLPQDITFSAKTGTSDEAKHGYTVLCDGETLIVTYISYGKVENDYLRLGQLPIPFESGGRSAGVLAAYIYNEVK